LFSFRTAIPGSKELPGIAVLKENN